MKNNSTIEENWVTKIRIEYLTNNNGDDDLDNNHWIYLGDYSTGLTSPSQVVNISLIQHDKKDMKYLIKAKYLRITPLEW